MSRWKLIAAAVPGGAVIGMLAWMAAGGASATSTQLASVQKQVSALRVPTPKGELAAAADLSGLVAAPVFPMSTGPGATPEPTIKVDGLVRSPRRIAALVSINGGPSEWLARGEMRDGVTLLDVSGAKAIVDTVFGEQAVGLGEQTKGTAAAGAALGPQPGPPIANDGPDQIPPGFKSPPPPASAPKAY